jgi:fatty acid synthase subunit beta, fungi type
MKTGQFLEIVNLNIRGKQYVCAGDLRALDCLQFVLDDIKGIQLENPLDAQTLASVVGQHASRYEGLAAPSVELRRGCATVPLLGVDVPFHSSFLSDRREPFKQVLLASLEKGRIDPMRLVQKYIPNVTGTPFDITKEYFEEVLRVTNSKTVNGVLNEWEEYWAPRIQEERLAMVLGA